MVVVGLGVVVGAVEKVMKCELMELTSLTLMKTLEETVDCNNNYLQVTIYPCAKQN